jgi:ribonuclease HI
MLLEDPFIAPHMLPPSPRPLCFVDASTQPDNGLSHMRRAGLGIYIFNLQVQPPNLTYIRVVTHETHNVIYVEAAALALAAVIIHRLGLHNVDFLSDSLQLVNLLNSEHPPDLPDWRMAPMIRMFQDYTRDRNSSVLKIDRQSNCIADSLARLAFSSSHLQYPDYVPYCSYEHKDLQCPLLAALSYAPLDFSRVLAVSCC